MGNDCSLPDIFPRIGLARICLCLATCQVLLAQGISVHRPEPKHGLHYETPATTWDEALPLGNGAMGALLWGDGRPLRISLDRADLWDLRKVPEFSGPEYKFRVMQRWHEEGRVKDLLRVYEDPYRRPAPTKIPAGRIELDYPEGTGFRDARLSLAGAVATVNFASGAGADAFVHATEAVGLVRFRGPMPRVRLVAPPFSGAVREAASGQIGAGDLAQLGYPAPVATEGQSWQAYTQQGAEGFHFAVYVEWRAVGTGTSELAWSIASSIEPAAAGKDPLTLARARVQSALRTGWSGMAGTHSKWWSSFWDRSSVRVPNPVLERQWYLDTYKWGSVARRGAPPITLQAVWTADDGKLPPWKGDYHHDLNTQLSYWPAYSGNRLEDGLGYLDWLWRTRDTAFEWTREFFELPGLNVPMTADLNGRQIGGWRQYTHSATTSAWLAHHFYLHWRYSQDREFLRGRAYPYLRDVAVFLEAFTAKRDAHGLRTHPLSASPEIHDNKPAAWFPEVTNYDLALDRWVFEKAAELAAALALKEDESRWRRVLAELPQLALAGDGTLLVAPEIALPESHRHFSHLMAVHPLGLIQWEQGDAAQRVIRASLADLDQKGTSRWCGYSFSWLGSLRARARDGAGAEKALEIFATAFCLRNSFHVNGDQSGKGYSKFTYRPFTLEGNFAMPAALHEMLLQSHSGTIEVFPAIPDHWKDAEFRTLRAEGAFLVSAKRSGGRVTRIEVLAEKGGTLRMLSPKDRSLIEVPMRPGQVHVFTD
ncbi:MAG: glycoside hydrolase N-terminal domain-containing protein [Bryobacterales bacterium]|nr:glycoside hydrolase N-terminal domain-containing protein [Bryobacterales bacterium]